MLNQKEARAWQDFNRDKIQDNNPKWPNEVMVKDSFW